MNEPAPQALIFDWDNTLVDSWPSITGALNAARSTFGLETWTVEEARRNSARAMRVSFPEWFGDQWEKARDIFYAHYEANHTTTVKPLDGAEALLQTTQSFGLPMIVVSNKRNDLLRAEINHLGWIPYFSSIKGSGDTPKDKPDAEPVFLAFHEAHIDLANGPVWFVGDSGVDVECAQNSGTVPVLVYNQALAQEKGIDLSFSDCLELNAKLYNIFRAKAVCNCNHGSFL